MFYFPFFVQCSESGWYVINWPPGSVILNYRCVSRSLLFYLRFNEISEKKDQYFITFNDLLPIWQHIFFIGHNNFNAVAESCSVIYWPPLFIIQDYGSHGSEYIRNIYGSGTLSGMQLETAHTALAAAFHLHLQMFATALGTCRKCCKWRIEFFLGMLLFFYH